MRFYIDTSIWMDLYEDRKGYNDEPLGEYALRLFSLIRAKAYKLIISDLLIKELEINYSIAEINGMLKPFEDITKKIFTNVEQRGKAINISKKRNIPAGDTLHAILAKDNDCTLITRDNHFLQLKDIINFYKPEEII